MAEGGGIQEENRRMFSAKRFAYDVLRITLLKFGFPESRLQVDVEDENPYPNNNDVLTVHAGIMVTVFECRDEWQRMFEFEFRSTGLSRMQEIEEFLLRLLESGQPQLLNVSDAVASENVAMSDEPPEFRLTPYLDKIRISLALFSEMIIFLHFKNIAVDFEWLLDLWSRYFNERIAIRENPDALLLAMFIEDDEITSFLGLLDYFIRDHAVPYGRKNNIIAFEYLKFSKALRKFASDENKSIAEIYEESKRMGCLPQKGLEPIPEEVEEAVLYFSDFIKNPDLPSYLGHYERMEQPHNIPVPSTSEVEERLQLMNLGSEGATPDSMDTTQVDDEPL